MCWHHAHRDENVLVCEAGNGAGAIQFDRIKSEQPQAAPKGGGTGMCLIKVTFAVVIFIGPSGQVLIQAAHEPGDIHQTLPPGFDDFLGL